MTTTIAARIAPTSARALDGSTLELPAVLGDGALLLVGFAAGHKDDAQAWAERVIEAMGADVPWVAVGVLPSKARLVSKVLVAGIKRALREPAWRARAAVLFDDVDAVAARLGVERTDAVAVLWARADGTVAWRASGPPTEDALAALRAAAEG